jgi:hypothetical protein
MRKLIALGACVLIALALSAPSAIAGGEVIRRGSCHGGGTWKLKVKPDNGGTEVEFEVDRNATGEDWHVVMKRNGDRFFSGNRTTSGASGSFEVRKHTNASGGDFVAKARRIGTAHTCTGRASL